MPDKKQDSPFTVTDRRLFTADGELRQETSEEEAPQAQPAATPKPSARAEEPPIPQPPSAAEENFLQNSLYELRMAYVEVTNALARPPRRRARIPPKDEGHADRPGQRHVHGRAHHWLRLRGLPFIRSARPPYSTFGSG